MPDLNSLPPSIRSSSRAPPTSFASTSPSPSPASGFTMSSPSPHQPPTQASPTPPSPSLPRSPNTSLQAAASVNAGLHHQHGSRRSSGSLSRQASLSSNHTRRQSQVLATLQLNDPSIPGPGEMVQDHSPRHHRSSRTSSVAPSASPFLIASGGDPHHQRSPSLGELHQEMEAEQEASVNRLLHQIRDQQAQIRQLQSDQSSAIAEEGAPAETAFYQAETSMLVRENQMLRHRVRELERQLEGMNRELPKEDEGPGEN